MGGLAGARLLSLCFMLGATSLLYGTTLRLFGRRAAVCAAAVFVILGPTQDLGAFATYDAMAIFLIALATWFAVRAQGAVTATASELFLVATGLALALADATKYACSPVDSHRSCRCLPDSADRRSAAIDAPRSPRCRLRRRAARPRVVQVRRRPLRPWHPGDDPTPVRGAPCLGTEHPPRFLCR